MVENRIIEDQRAIKAVTSLGEHGDGWIVGWSNKGITKIVSYLENGQMEQVPWLAVYRGEVIIWRINCAAVESIEYVDETQDPVPGQRDWCKEEFLRDCATCRATGRGLMKRRINETNT